MRVIGSTVTALAAALAVFAIAAQAATDSGNAREARATPQPRVIQLSYSEVNDGTFPATG